VSAQIPNPDTASCDRIRTELSNLKVFSLNPTFLESEAPDARSLFDRAQTGDAEAFGEICRAYEARLLRHAMTLCGNATLAEDLAQDTLVEAWKCLRRYNGHCQFFTWLCAILLNRYRNVMREKRPIPFSTLADHDRSAFFRSIENGFAREVSPDAAAQIQERAVLLQRCIQLLPSKHQQVIYLRFYVDRSLEGIAAALGCSVGTVKSRLFHALEKIRGMNALNK
jgi:RNA polymerase sigma-70 factor (ECF subfamily)